MKGRQHGPPSKAFGCHPLAPKTLGQSPPRVVALNLEAPVVCAQGGLLGTKYILLSHAASEALNEAELGAIAAHEVAHLAWDVATLRILRGLTVLLMMPGQYLTVLYDFEGREGQADAFAVRAVGQAASFKSALVKMSVSRAVMKPSSAKSASSPETRLRAWWRMIVDTNWELRWLSIMCSNAILTGAYTSLPRRLAAIEHCTSVGDRGEGNPACRQ